MHARGCVALRQPAKQGAGARLVLRRQIGLKSFAPAIATTAAAPPATPAKATAVQQQQLQKKQINMA